MRPASDPNVARSVMDRLKNEAKGTGEAFNPLLTRYVGFRLLHRLSVSEFRDRFFVKGATMFLLWTGSTHRPTKDIDLLGLTVQDEAEIAQTFRELCGIACPEDGVVFDPESVQAGLIREEQTYGGIRVTLVGYLGNAKVHLQIDIGFGDAVTPEAQEIELPAIVRDVPPVRLKGYPAESAIAEKFQALTFLGLENSRMKDFFDIAYLADTMEFEASTLGEAIRATFKRRKTDLPESTPVALTKEFYENDLVATRWRAFVRKNDIRSPYNGLQTVIHHVERFLAPALENARSERPSVARWQSGDWHGE